MKYYFLVILIVVFFSGCGESSSMPTIPDENATENTPTSNFFDGLVSEQWYMSKDETFYSQNQIDSEAHIHPTTTTYQTYTGKGVKVAIIDNGFDITHPEIKDNIIYTASISTNRWGNIFESSVVSHTLSTDYHGTAVAGIIGSKDDQIGTRGIAPDSSLILIKMPANFTDDAIITMFNKAIEAGADVINCSWGTGDTSQTVRDYINTIANTARNGKGVVIVFASGNDDKEIGDDESGIENVIGVGATDGDNLRTTYSNYGSLLDIVAPGGYYDSIATIDPVGTYGATSDDYNRYNQIQDGYEVSFIGTSAAAPIITGAIALLLEKDPTLTRAQIQEKLQSATDTIGQNTPYLYDMVTSSSQRPMISGIYGTNKLSTFKVKLTSYDTNTTYGSYSVTPSDNNTWNSTVTATLPNGNYKIELIDDDAITIWATDNNFTIDTSLSFSTINTQKLKSNYYGYGKINLSKLLQ